MKSQVCRVARAQLPELVKPTKLIQVGQERKLFHSIFNTELEEEGKAAEENGKAQQQQQTSSKVLISIAFSFPHFFRRFRG